MNYNNSTYFLIKNNIVNLSSFSTSQEFNDFLNKAYEVGYRSKLFAQSRGDYYSLILSKIISEVGVTHSLDFMLSESENFFLIDYLRLDGCISDLNELINWCINNIKFLYDLYFGLVKWDEYCVTQEDIINIINRAKMTRIEEFKSEDNQHILYVFTYIFEVKRLLEEAKNNEMAIIVCSSGH